MKLDTLPLSLFSSFLMYCKVRLNYSSFLVRIWRSSLIININHIDNQDRIDLIHQIQLTMNKTIDKKPFQFKMFTIFFQFNAYKRSWSANLSLSEFEGKLNTSSCGFRVIRKVQGQTISSGRSKSGNEIDKLVLNSISFIKTVGKGIVLVVKRNIVELNIEMNICEGDWVSCCSKLK